MEPKTQVEIQLGHMCNNRCVFCVSGQETGLGRARAMPVEPLLDSVSEAYERGHRKLTLLGGEPTLQPGFKQVVEHAVSLGFEEIVLFTNGVKTAREGFIDEVIGLGGNFTWRISIQGANKTAHERTTKKPGSFDRILQSLEHLFRKGQRITINMCVVRSNFESVDEFPELVSRYGATQLHLDMVRPMDAGSRTDEEFREMIPRYQDLVGPLARMIEGFPGDFDVNIGNLPYCIAPHLSRWIHHDGEQTDTIAIDGEQTLSRPWNKYFVKRRDKLKPESCRECVFDSRCSDIFEKYRELYGTDELVPITPAMSRRADPELHLLAVHFKSVVDELQAWTPPPPFDRVTGLVVNDLEARVTLHAGERRLVVGLGAPGDGAASVDLFSLRVIEVPDDRGLVLGGLDALWNRLAEGRRVLHPFGEDALVGSAARSIAVRLVRLRRRAPFGALEWRTLHLSEAGRRAELGLQSPLGEKATVWLAEENGRARGGYELESEAPSPALVEGLRELMSALKPGASPATPDDARR